MNKNPDMLLQAQIALEQGQFAQARSLAERVLQQQPAQAEAWHLLALVAYESGQALSALPLLQRAVALRPEYPVYYNSLGVAALAAGQPGLALSAFRHAARLNPHDPYLQLNLANLLLEQGCPAEALPTYRQALALNPGDPEICLNVATALQQAGQFDEAEALLRNILQLRPQDCDIYLQLAQLLYTQTRYLEARELLGSSACSQMAAGQHLLGLNLMAEQQAQAALPHLRAAAEARPDQADYVVNYASCLLETGSPKLKMGALRRIQAHIDEAMQLLERILARHPELPEAHYNLGWALANQTRHAEAVLAYQQALRLRPDYAEAWSSLAHSQLELEQVPECLAACRRALDLKPDLAKAHMCYAAALLSCGDFVRGFAEYEWRILKPHLPAGALEVPFWTGEELSGSTLLINYEQGFGDMLQHARYLALIRAHWPEAKLIVRLPPELVRLFRTLPGELMVLSRHQPIPMAYDYFVAIASLPGLFASRTPIPAAVPYFYPHADAGPLLPAQAGTGLKVGLVWASGLEGLTYQKRSLSLHELEPLLSVPGVQWYSLQMGPARAEIAGLRTQAAITDLAPLIEDFYDTARLLQQLDLLITVDTSVCHLAGALGQPVWTLLPFAADWRWMLNCSDSYWYPSMRLFRQPRPRDSASMIQAVELSLRAELQGRAGG
ncbi:MAG: tetratricopeptide repeat protein [Candidatus Sericytochromatia bacterium]